MGHYIDLTEVRSCAPCHRIVGQKVLRSQLIADLLKRPLELRDVRGVVILPSGVVRDLNKCVLSTGVTPGARLDWNVDQAVHERLRLLRGSKRFLVVDTACRVPTVGDQYHHLAPFAIDECLSSQVDRIVERRSTANSHFANRSVDLMQLRRERRHLAHARGEGVESDRILRPDHGMDKSSCSLQFQANVFARARARVDCHHDRQWQLRFLAEDGNLLRHTIFAQSKVTLNKIANRRALLVRDRHKHVHQLYIDLEGRFWCLLSTQRGDQSQGGNCRGQPSHWSPPVIESAFARSSSGNGSPSAHTAPSVKCSFFQIGTIRLSVSMVNRQASKAAARWAEATTTSTLVSPISRRPSRWMIAISLIL